MDLLGDIGTADQLTSARAENAVLQKHVKELTEQVKVLTVEKAALEVEVEMYREKEKATNILTKNDNDNTNDANATTTTIDNKNNTTSSIFFKSGDGQYCNHVDTILNDLHGNANPLCVSSNPNNTNNNMIVVTGGADNTVRFTSTSSSTSNTVTDHTNHSKPVPLSAPVITVQVAPTTVSSLLVVAAGCMDGMVSLLIYYKSDDNNNETIHKISLQKHTKYIKTMTWSNAITTNKYNLAVGSADGTIHIYQVTVDSMKLLMNDIEVAITHESLHSYHMDSPIESLCYDTKTNTRLYAYVRGTPHLTVFNNDDENTTTFINLNTNKKDAVTGGFDTHVSFAILDMKISPCKQYIACATDTNRHIILENNTNNYNQIRNLYGHDSDTFSNPKIGWSCNSLYIYSTTQNHNEIIIYEIASSKIITRIGSLHHLRPIKDLWCHPILNIIISISFDKKTIIWTIDDE